LIAAFLKVYPAQREEMRRTLGDLYDEADYPVAREIRDRFWVSTMMMELNAPESLKGISGVMYQEEVARIRNVWEETKGTITAALYQEMAELVNGLVERLTVREGEKAQALRPGAVAKFQEWLDLFGARNLTRDQDLEVIVERARAVVSGVDVETIRESKGLRQELAATFADLKKELTAAIGARPSRKIRLEE
jgi:hypothetical protein